MAGKKGQKKRAWSDDEKLCICAQAWFSGVSVELRYAMNTNLIHKWLRDPRFVSEEHAADMEPVPAAPVLSTSSVGSVTAQRVDITLSDGLHVL